MCFQQLLRDFSLSGAVGTLDVAFDFVPAGGGRGQKANRVGRVPSAISWHHTDSPSQQLANTHALFIITYVPKSTLIWTRQLQWVGS